MVKGIASTVLVGSLAAMFACSSSSPAGTGFPASNEAGAMTTDDGGGSSSSSGSSGGSSNGSGNDASTSDSCPDPLTASAAITGMTPSASCKTCVNTKCTSSLDACKTATCLSCGSAVLSCAQSSCSEKCFPPNDAGASSGGSADGGCASPGPKCAQTKKCCTTLANFGALGTSYQPVCKAAADSCNESSCTTFLMGTVPVLNMPVTAICP